ncbi:MAG: chloride channel protein, partial [Candidatus Methanomethylicota archaeon]
FDAIPIIIAVVIGTAVATSYLGTQPAFNTAGLTFKEPTELLFYALLGIAFGFIAVFWVKLFYFIERAFGKARIPEEIKPAIGGVLTGIIGMLLPQYGILGVGYNGIEAALAGEIPALTLLALGIVKMLATSFTVGSGGSGGIFAPTLYIGCMIGGSMGLLFKHLAPTLVTQPFTYSLAGMAALFAGAAQAPLTVMIMIPEMSNNYSLLLPLMVSSALSYFIAWTFMKGSSIYTLKLEQRGVHIKVGRPEVLDMIMVKEVMSKQVISVKSDMPVSLLELMIFETGHTGFPVVESGKLVGIVTIDDIGKVKPEDRNKVKVGEIATRKLVVAYPDETLSAVLTKMYENNIGRLPVVDPKDKTKLIGIISKTDILRAYRKFKEL